MKKVLKSGSPPLLPYMLLISVALMEIVFGLFNAPPSEIFHGILMIIEDPDYLVSDYIGVGGIGAAFVNSGILSLLIIALLHSQRTVVSGITIASVFTVAGFAFFGKNIFNVWFIIAGVYVYSRYRDEDFSKYIYIAVFGTALSPLVSQIIFGSAVPWSFRIVLGGGAGVLTGFILPPLASHMLKVHQGFNLYNIGFVSGVIGTLYVSVLRSYGFLMESRMIWSRGNDLMIGLFLFVLFAFLIILGLALSERPYLRGPLSVWKYSGRLVTDFITLEGWGPTLINMGLMGIAGTLYIVGIGGDLNGPTTGGIFTLVGFSAFGKHPKNTLPVLLGIILGGLTKSWNIADPPIQLAALFSTTLAPLSGEFGWRWGVLSGYIHSSVVLNVGMLHAGFNLYNNGFAGGIVAAAIAPLATQLSRRKED